MNEVIERCNSAVSDISQGPLAVEIGEPMAHLEVLADAACLVVPTSEPGGPARLPRRVTSTGRCQMTLETSTISAARSRSHPEVA